MPAMSHPRNILPRRLTSVPTTGSWPDEVTIRRADAEDEPALARLAELDSRPPLTGPVLIAEVGGEIWAAAEIEGAWVLADPFRPSGEVALTVAQRAAELRMAAARAARRKRRLARAARKAALSAAS